MDNKDYYKTVICYDLHGKNKTMMNILLKKGSMFQDIRDELGAERINWDNLSSTRGLEGEVHPINRLHAHFTIPITKAEFQGRVSKHNKKVCPNLDTFVYF